MNVADIQRGNISTASVVVEQPPKGFPFWRPGQEVRLIFSPELQTVILDDEQHSLQVAPAARRDAAILDTILRRGQTLLCWVAAVSEKDGAGLLDLRIHEFDSHQPWAERFTISIDSELVTKIRHKQRARLTVQSIVEELKNDFVMPPGPKETLSRALVSMSPADDKHSHRVVRFFGKSRALDVRLERTNSHMTARAYRIVEARAAQRNEDRYPLTLVHGDFVFQDKTDSGMSASIRSEIDLLVQNADSYLRVWQMYGELEAQSLKDEADALGTVAYADVRQIDEVHWQFHIPGEEEFSACEEMLRSGQHKDLCVKPAASSDYDANGGREARFSGEMVGVFPNSRQIEILARSTDSPAPPPRGELALDLTGDSVRQERRARARAMIRSAECPMPQLGLIIEGRPWTTSYRKKWQKVPQAVMDKFRGAPTEGQRKALLVAINTPDIALIQGPPGTGKTQVISALLVWLSKIGEGDIQKSTLITSFQHDAVENVAGRSRVFGLPPIRIGSRRREDTSTRPFELWMAEMRHKAREMIKKYEALPIFKASGKLEDMYASYSVCPGDPDATVKLLAEVEAVAGPWLSPALNDRVRAVAAEMAQDARLKNAPNDQRRQLLDAAIRGLRVDKTAFEDDGPRSCHRLHRRLSDCGLLNDEDEQMLKAGMEWKLGEPLPFLDRLCGIQERLLDSLIAGDSILSARAENERVTQVLHEAAVYVQSRCKDAMYSRDAVLFRYAGDLENNPYGCEQAVEAYAAVLASTVGQSVGISMNRVLAEEACFENVIVDEAARANPLDLMIPLSRAERRIILVGDHRQLPHVLETHIEREVRQSVEEKTRDILGRSLFERLLQYIREQEKRDGIPATPCSTSSSGCTRPWPSSSAAHSTSPMARISHRA